MSNSTLKDRIGHLRILAEESDFEKQLVGQSPCQINETLFQLQTERGWSDGTKRNYEKSIRSFFRFHGYDDKTEEIDLTKAETPKFDRDDIVLRDDLRDLLDGLDSARDQALLAVMWEGGMRITALLSLRVKDYTPQGDQYSLIEIPSAVEAK